ncbi:hypothetical protein B0A55_05267 [Friedmanniomyces simplex]|uniref:Uncharacterized protein n=1 Tax=Friedmanniomyces simplex TaxID=329884 RepID=A0A4U0WFP3_9PEZI|nr:hypothetical protein B0A55_11262 [Friedmanniomyces simplex]TKA76380.1 hypothetical protein B0A55_05267 [Friedmanniomyces simplex]
MPSSEENFNAAAKLRPSRPPPVPPKPVDYKAKNNKAQREPAAKRSIPSSNKGTAGATAMSKSAAMSKQTATESQVTKPQRTSIGKFALLPNIASTDRPRDFPHPFSVNVELQLLQPRHLYKLNDLPQPEVVAHQGTIVYISPSHTHEQMRDQLVLLASTVFPLDLSDTERWRCSLTGSCDAAARDSVISADFGAIVSASKQGGWTWMLSLVEVIKNNRGRWSTVGLVDPPVILDPRGVHAIKAKMREV